MLQSQFWASTNSESGCLVWSRATDVHGYGRVKWEGVTVLAHRLAFFFMEGRWPSGVLRHECDNPPCVLHTLEGTQADNVADRERRGRGRNGNETKTRCPQGHPYSEVNTYRTPSGRRNCKQCRLVATRRWRSRNMETA